MNPTVLPEWTSSYTYKSVLPYINSTEEGQESVLEELSQIEEKENSFLLGFSLDFNYNILSKRKISRSLICDIDLKMIEIYHWISQNIIGTKREEFIQNMAKFLNKEFPNNEGLIDTFQKEHDKQVFMWTSSDDSYSRIQTMYKEGRISHLALNLSKDLEYFDTLSDYLKDNQSTVDIIYVSNIPEWLRHEPNGLENLCRNVKKIASDTSVFIDAKKKPENKEKVTLRLLRKATEIDKSLFTENSLKRKRTFDRAITQRSRPNGPLF